MKGDNYSILLVEDDDSHAEIVRRNFEESGKPHRLVRLRDGQAALDYIYRQGEFSDSERYPRPGLIIIDLRLPMVDGLVVLNVIKSDPDLLRIPTLVLSTSAAEDDKAMAYASHANSYLVKPLDCVRFSTMIEVMCDFWLGWNEPPL